MLYADLFLAKYILQEIKHMKTWLCKYYAIKAGFHSNWLVCSLVDILIDFIKLGEPKFL